MQAYTPSLSTAIARNLKVSEELTCSSLTVLNTLHIEEAVVSFEAGTGLLFNQALVPNGTCDLGTQDAKWRHLYVSSGSVYLGDVTLSNPTTNTVNIDGNMNLTTGHNFSIDGVTVVGPQGDAGPQGPPGVIGAQGSNYGDYIYWSTASNDWAVGSSQINIGANAGTTSQQSYAVAIGQQAGSNLQGSGAIAIGYQAGYTNQSSSAVAIGETAGQSDQGQYAVAIGYQAGKTSQHAGTIVINATGAALNTDGSGRCFIRPVRSLGTNSTQSFLAYDSSTSEVTYATAKNFIIDHPQDPSKFLVHACLEGPEAGVYYRGKLYVDHVATVSLPKYARAFQDFTVQVTPINTPSKFMVSEVEDNKFTISLEEPGWVHWLAIGERCSIDVELDKSSVEIGGDGPYKYIKRSC